MVRKLMKIIKIFFLKPEKALLLNDLTENDCSMRHESAPYLAGFVVEAPQYNRVMNGLSELYENVDFDIIHACWWMKSISLIITSRGLEVVEHHNVMCPFTGRYSRDLIRHKAQRMGYRFSLN